ncbi:MAG TPA: hypothetical protein EYP59_11905 [Thiotrichaceae bacterium]|nr:hypothetical protein [Thiotrichaceae bacterium]
MGKPAKFLNSTGFLKGRIPIFTVIIFITDNGELAILFSMFHRPALKKERKNKKGTRLELNFEKNKR